MKNKLKTISVGLTMAGCVMFTSSYVENPAAECPFLEPVKLQAMDNTQLQNSFEGCGVDVSAGVKSESIRFDPLIVSPEQIIPRMEEKPCFNRVQDREDEYLTQLYEEAKNIKLSICAKVDPGKVANCQTSVNRLYVTYAMIIREKAAHAKRFCEGEVKPFTCALGEDICKINKDFFNSIKFIINSEK